ncbi:hypothetical protein B296_00024997 [Ensete ventricosum]|uniref:Uncharacterized protein n=1 Tax=Ensete ventricosum TaxID=4639 RepID=A0A426Y4X1_ENSVE|nr:hypothetical protein B296_00024997 [Ensete ventricosum]
MLVRLPGERFPVRDVGFSLGRFSQGKVTAFPCSHALLTLALTISAGDDNIFPYRTTSGKWRAIAPLAISPLRSFYGEFRRGRMAVASAIGEFRRGRMVVTSAIDVSKRGRTVIASTIDDFRRGRAMASSPLGAG